MNPIENNVPLAPLSSFKVGGVARYYLAPDSKEGLIEGLNWAHARGHNVFVFGKGSNLVFSDDGFDGLVINIGKSLSRVIWEEQSVKAGAGILLHSVVLQAVARGLAGIERLAGIPGSLGGGVFMNAGAFGQELGHVVSSVGSCTYTGEIVKRNKEECEFAYRHSIFNNLKEVILEITMDLTPGDKSELEYMVREYLKRRKEKQPLSFPNAGSMFKRPEIGFAGALIEEAGLKGLQTGGAEVSDKHANFIINKGDATAQDIFDLSEEVSQTVLKYQGVKMEKEVRFVGNFLPWPRKR